MFYHATSSVSEEDFKKDFWRAACAHIMMKTFDEVTREERTRTKLAFFNAFPHFLKHQADYVQEAFARQAAELEEEEQ